MAVIFLITPFSARAGDIVTEFGVGWKISETTSALMLPECSTARILGDSDHARVNGTASCGGDNPIFMGWIVAYEWNPAPAWTHRVGYYHFSSFLEGDSTLALKGDGRELHFDCVCYSTKFNWSAWWRNRR